MTKSTMLNKQNVPQNLNSEELKSLMPLPSLETPKLN